MNNLEYTSRSYWENYYAQSKVNKNQIIKIGSNFDFFWDQLINSCDHQPKSIIEIGAYPGRYIAYLAAKYGLAASALDYNSDILKFREAFAAMDVINYEIIQTDFLTNIPQKKWDIVISIGFIEHFGDYNKVLDKHLDYLAEGGAMIIMIPNKRFLRKWYGKLVDKKNLEIHNLKCMKLSVFKEFASRNNLNIQYLNYEGGFPFNVHQPLVFWQKIIYKLTRLIFINLNKVLKKHPSKWWSGTIIGIFVKSK